MNKNYGPMSDFFWVLAAIVLIVALVLFFTAVLIPNWNAKNKAKYQKTKRAAIDKLFTDSIARERTQVN